MDFELNEDQQAILEAVDRLLEQHAGPARAVELNKTGAYDFDLHNALEESGFSNVMNDMADPEREGSLAGLEAALVVESAARAASVASIGAQLLVAPTISTEPIEGPVALCTEAQLNKPVPVRYGAQAKTLLVLCENDVKVIPLKEGDMEPIRTSFGYPLGRLTRDVSAEATSLGAEAAVTMANWWRIALAAEAVGTMDAALNHTVEYLKQRRQFGRTIASFQAIQHRLSLCAVHLEGSRWLMREAAYHGATAEASATAAAFSLNAADQIFTEGHQMSGAIGFTHEFDLHVWTMRLQALRQEMSGLAGHRSTLVNARWRKSA